MQAVEAPRGGGRYDLVLVPVQAGQLAATIPVLASMTDGSDARELPDAVHRTGHPAPALDTLPSPSPHGRTAV